MNDKRRVAVVFPAGQGGPDWERRSSASPLPSRWPYGLDLLASDDVEVTHRETDPADRATRLALASHLVSPRAVRRIGRHAGGSEALDSALCWDENTALAMATQVDAKRYSSGVIWITDAAERRMPRRYLAAVRTVLRRMDALWVLARPQVDKLTAWLGPGHPPVHFVRFGVDTAYYRPAPATSLPLITSFGNDRDRDVRTLYAALQLVLEQRPDVRCIVQSNAPLRPPAGVTVHEHLPHVAVRDLIAASSAVAIATRPNWHVSGMTVALEAAACGRPVVASRTAGIDDYIRDGETGDLIDPGDAEGLAGRLLGLVSDPERAQALGRAGRARVRAEHSTATMADALRAIVAPGPASR